MFYYMHANLQSQGFKIKEIYVIVLSISSVYCNWDISWSRRLGGFLPLTAAKLMLVWKISDQSIKNMLPTFSYLNKVLCFVVCGSVINRFLFSPLQFVYWKISDPHTCQTCHQIPTKGTKNITVFFVGILTNTKIIYDTKHMYRARHIFMLAFL